MNAMSSARDIAGKEGSYVLFAVSSARDIVGRNSKHFNITCRCCVFRPTTILLYLNAVGEEHQQRRKVIVFQPWFLESAVGGSFVVPSCILSVVSRSEF
jgi:hypothetical protein